MKTTKLIRSITVAGTFAAALSLSACDMHVTFGDPQQNQNESQSQNETPQPPEEGANPEEAQQGEVETNEPAAGDSPGTSSSQGSSSSDGSGASSSSSSSSSGTSASAGEGSSSSSGEGSEADSPGFDIDENGNGTIPASLLEKDIKNAYAKQGTTVDEVECLNDLMIISKRGSASCNVTAYGKKRYGTVKVTSVSGANVGYSLDFPSFN